MYLFFCESRTVWATILSAKTLIIHGNFLFGDSYKLWVEVDSSFDSAFYEISWVVTQDYTTVIKKGTGSVIAFTLNNKNVSYAPEIRISLITKRDWHRFHNVDDIIEIHYQEVLPPIEDTY